MSRLIRNFKELQETIVDDVFLDNLALRVKNNKSEELFELFTLFFFNLEYIEQTKKIDEKYVPKIFEIVMNINKSCESDDVYYLTLKTIQTLNKVMPNYSQIELLDKLFKKYK